MQDLFNSLLVRELDRIHASAETREDADAALAELLRGLRADSLDDEAAGPGEGRNASRNDAAERTLTQRLLGEYLLLSDDDAADLSPDVHEWILDRVVVTEASLTPRATSILAALCRVFPATTLSYTATGGLLQLDQERMPSAAAPPVANVWRGDETRAGAREQNDELLLPLADDIVSYAEFLPDAVERALRALMADMGGPRLAEHLESRAARLGGLSAQVIRRVLN